MKTFNLCTVAILMLFVSCSKTDIISYEIGLTEEGIYEEGNNPLLLIHGPLLSGQTWQTLKKVQNESALDGLRFIYEFQTKKGIFNSARLLSTELAKAHEQYGDFEINIVTHSYGVLVAMAYIGDTTLYHNDVERLLAVAPPLNGSPLVESENTTELLRLAEEGVLTDLEIANSLIFAETLGEHSDFLSRDNEALNDLYESFKNIAMNKQFGGNSETNIEIEVIRGNKPFFDINSIAGIKTDSPLAALGELMDGAGDGLMDIDLNRKGRKISLLAMEPLPYNHLEIINQKSICKKITEFLDIPKQYSVSMVDNPSMVDYYKESDYEIKVHNWRNENTDLLHDYNKDMLNSMEQDAILFTNGDYDTYYGLDLQHKEGFREDITIINLSLLNTAKFIKVLKSRIPLPDKVTDHYIEEVLAPKDEQNLKERRWTDVQKVSVNGPTPDSPKLVWDVKATLSYPTGAEGETEHYLRVQDMMILNILEANNWERPIYFAVTVSDANLLGLRDVRDLSKNYLSMEGLVFRLYPTSMPLINARMIEENMFKRYQYCNAKDPGTILTKNNLKLLGNYRQGLLQLAFQYMQEASEEGDSSLARADLDMNQRITIFNSLSKYEKALTALEFMDYQIPEELVPIRIDLITLQIGRLYAMLGKPDEFITRLDNITKNMGMSVQKAYEYGIYYLTEAEDMTGARRMFDHCLENVDDIEYYQQITYYWLQLSQDKTYPAEVLRKFLEQHNDRQSKISIASHALSIGLGDFAFTIYEHMRLTDPGDKVAVDGLIEYYELQGNFKRAMMLVNDWLVNYPSDSEMERKKNDLTASMEKESQ